jgi:hypothetical protein
MDRPKIELEIRPTGTPDEYSVQVLRAAAGGEPHATFTLKTDDLRRGSRVLQNTVLASAAQARGVAVPELEKPMRQIGLQLFEAVFSGQIGNTYRASQAVARDRNEDLRIVLRLNAPELAVMPWEALYDDEHDLYVCRTEPIIRHIDAPYSPHPPPVNPPLRILGLVASPHSLTELDVEAEQEHLEEALASPILAGQVVVDWLTHATYTTVHQRLLRGAPPHVVHFIGHGRYNQETNEGSIALEGAGGRADWTPAQTLAELLNVTNPTPRLVVLNSCASGQGGNDDLFSGAAATLVRRGISAVAAMQFSISDTAAVAFPRGFYTALAAGRSVDEAVHSGRMEIVGTGQGTLEWVTPVLYVRGDANAMLTLVEPSAATDPDELADRARETAAQRQTRRQGDIAALSEQADAAASHSDWDTVVSALEKLIDVDPANLDASARLEQARMFRAVDYSRVEEFEQITLTADGELYCAEFSPDQQTIAAGSEKEVLIWQLPAAKGQEAALKLAHDDYVYSVAFTPDGKILVTGCEDGAVRFWDSHTGKIIRTVAKVHNGSAVYAVATSGDGAYLATGGYDGYVQLWNLPGRTLRTKPHYVGGPVSSLAFPRQGNKLAVGNHNNQIQLWDIDKKQWSTLGEHQSSVESVAFSPDGSLLASCGLDKQVLLWNVDSHEQLWKPRAGHEYLVKSVAFSPNGRVIASASWDKTVRLWDVEDDLEAQIIPWGDENLDWHTDWIWAASFSPDGRMLATAGSDEQLILWTIPLRAD